MKGKKGSLTVEAIISFTVFISVMFLLLTLVKLVLTMTILNNATVETAKTFATGAYPISILNEKQAGIEKKADAIQPANLQESLKASVSSGIITQLLGGDWKKMAAGSAASTLTDLIEGAAVELGKNAVYQLKGQTVNYLCGKVLQGYVENCGIRIDPEKLMLRAVKIPETETEFKSLHGESMSLSDSGGLTAAAASGPFAKDGDFNAEDVLICLEYPYEIALPLLPSFTVTLRSVSVEHAWLHGTSAGPKRTEGICVQDILFGKETVVYVATGGHGKRYHKETCSTLWSSYTSESLSVAKAAGLTPCKVCNPPVK